MTSAAHKALTGGQSLAARLVRLAFSYRHDDGAQLGVRAKLLAAEANVEFWRAMADREEVPEDERKVVRSLAQSAAEKIIQTLTELGMLEDSRTVH